MVIFVAIKERATLKPSDDRSSRVISFSKILFFILLHCLLYLDNGSDGFKIINSQRSFVQRKHDELHDGNRRITKRETVSKNGAIFNERNDKLLTKSSTATNSNKYTDSVEEEEQNDDNTKQDQNFFQSFAPLFSNSPLSHSRPLLYPDQSFRGSFRHGTLRELSGMNDNLLGSGNFGVIKGGTYYANEESSDFGLDDFSSYLGNGHSRPSHYKRNPLPAYRNGGDFFANFRDFADITAPSKSAFSQYYLVYVNQNATANDENKSPAASRQTNDRHPTKQHYRPKNIIEQLDMLEDNVTINANQNSTDSGTGSLAEEDEKLSESKKKLKRYKEQIKNKETRRKSALFSPAKEIADPLIALS